MRAREAKAAIHFRNVTTRQGFDLIRAAKAEGLVVTCGISPAYLFLSDNAVSGFRTFARLSPPLRREADRPAAPQPSPDGPLHVLSSSSAQRGPADNRLPFAAAAPGL